MKKFDEKEKISINKKEFIKNEIKEKRGLLKLDENINYFDGTIGYLETYTDLINGNRVKYFNNIKLSKKAGETEGILMYISHLESLLSKEKPIRLKNNQNPTFQLLPIEIFENTRGYLRKNVVQINTSYKYKAYDACFVLQRKVLEILIIEAYEKEKIEEKIEDIDGNYFMLGKLITLFLTEKKFKKLITRNFKESIPKIKKNGDLSAHNPKYNATKNDVDKLSEDFRLVFQELVNSIY